MENWPLNPKGSPKDPDNSENGGEIRKMEASFLRAISLHKNARFKVASGFRVVPPKLKPETFNSNPKPSICLNLLNHKTPP